MSFLVFQGSSCRPLGQEIPVVANIQIERKLLLLFFPQARKIQDSKAALSPNHPKGIFTAFSISFLFQQPSFWLVKDINSVNPLSRINYILTQMFHKLNTYYLHTQSRNRRRSSSAETQSSFESTETGSSTDSEGNETSSGSPPNHIPRWRLVCHTLKPIKPENMPVCLPFPPLNSLVRR